jgi:hypothetical protein
LLLEVWGLKKQLKAKDLELAKADAEVSPLPPTPHPLHSLV